MFVCLRVFVLLAGCFDGVLGGLFVCLCVRVGVCLFVWLFLFVKLFARFCLFVCLVVRVFVCLSVRASKCVIASTLSC